MGCPGCHALGEEPCAPGCIDAAIEADREERRERELDEDIARGDYEIIDDDGDLDLNDANDWEYAP